MAIADLTVTNQTMLGKASLPSTDDQAIDFAEQILGALRRGELIGFAAILHRRDGSMGLTTTGSVLAIEGMEAVNALGELQHRLS